MAPIKFEKDIKEKLEGREIKPSDNAWEEVSGRIEVSKSERKRSFAWYAVAASFIGLIMMSVFFFKNEEILEEPKTPLVIQDEKTDGLNNMSDFQQEEVVIVDNVFEQEEKGALLEIKKENKEKIQLSSTIVKGELSREEDKLVALSESEKIINNKIAEVVAEVNHLEKKNISLTDVEVDSLLRKAQREILADKIFIASNKVDPATLLAEAEYELDQTFRDQIFKTLKNGLEKVSTAVADRNN